MKKQGFTLIELMVVIVIMGILAAVAVPKLFGMIAKSKASEIGPAAGEYVKLQDAYISETGVYIGNWKAIGYKMDPSSNFNYDEAAANKTWTSNSTTLSGGATDAWTATNYATLNDCGNGAKWAIKVEQNGSTGGAALYDASITAGSAGTKTDCEVLNPSFVKLDTKDRAI